VRRASTVFAFTIAVISINAAMAFPDGAPWGAANPAATDHCANCHFDSDPVHNSPALSVEGLAEVMKPGNDYPLTIVLADTNAVIAGFQLIASADDQPVGLFTTEEPNAETAGAAIRSTAPVPSEGIVRWMLNWHAPESGKQPIVFHVAATAANHDGSPFGDLIHYRAYTVELY
jgi:hypothetical protein